jgi:putative phosphoesterase
MTTAFIADIHGNYEALKSVLSELDKLGISEVYCAGDIAGYYTQVNECCHEMRVRGIHSVMGNHDWYLAGGGFCARSKSVNDCLAYQRKVIEPANLEWLSKLPVQIRAGEIRVVHGGWADPLDEYLKPIPHYFDGLEGRLFVYGHTHVQTLGTSNGKTFCNPGSVGQPRDGDPKAAFAIHDGDQFELRRVEYDIQKVFDLMEAAGFNDYYYGGLKTGSQHLRRLSDQL